jgi:hypothetical protein
MFENRHFVVLLFKQWHWEKGAFRNCGFFLEVLSTLLVNLGWPTLFFFFFKFSSSLKFYRGDIPQLLTSCQAINNSQTVKKFSLISLFWK